MAFNGSGTFNRLYNWATDDGNGINIEASRMDGEDDGFATGLSNCITKDGQTTITANIPFNSKKITGLANGSARTDSIVLGQVQDNQFGCLGTTGGSADAYTLTPSPAITAYTATMEFTVKINATNATTTPYLQISGIADPATNAVIKKLDNSKSETSLAVGDLVANGIYKFKRNSANDAWIALNPEKDYLDLSNSKATTSAVGAVFLPKRIIGSNNSTDSEHDIDFTAGVINFSDGSGQAYIGALTKLADATFATGNGSGAMASGQSLPASGTVHWFGLSDADGTTVDIGCDTDVDATNLMSDSVVVAAGLTKYKRILSLRTDSSSNFLAFTQYANHIFWSSPPTDLSTSSTSTSKTDLSITVPNSIELMVTLAIGGREGGTILGNIFSEGQDDSAPVQDNRDFYMESGNRTGLEVTRYTSSATIAYRLSATTPDKFTIKTKSFIDLGI